MPKTVFMLDHGNYYYNVMPFGLKNVGATHHQLMDEVFAHQIGRNLEVYINDMIAKTEGKHSHDSVLKDILESLRRYDMHLNSSKFSFRVQAGEFLGFVLTKRGIEPNPDKF